MNDMHPKTRECQFNEVRDEDLKCSKKATDSQRINSLFTAFFEYSFIYSCL